MRHLVMLLFFSLYSNRLLCVIAKGKSQCLKISVYCMTPDHCVRHNCFRDGFSVFAFSCATTQSWISVTESSCKIPDSPKLYLQTPENQLFLFGFQLVWAYRDLPSCFSGWTSTSQWFAPFSLSFHRFSLSHRCLIRVRSLKLLFTGVQIHSQPLNDQTQGKQLTVFIPIISCPALRIDVVCLLFSGGF